MKETSWHPILRTTRAPHRHKCRLFLQFFHLLQEFEPDNKNKTRGSLEISVCFRMRVGNVFSHVCLSVCLSVCVSVHLSVCPSVSPSIRPSIHLSVYMPVKPITFEPLHIETSFLVHRYIFTISRTRLSIKVIGSRSRSFEKMYNFTYFNIFILCMLLQIINKVKVTHQGQGHIKFKVKYLPPSNFM